MKSCCDRYPFTSSSFVTDQVCFYVLVTVSVKELGKSKTSIFFLSLVEMLLLLFRILFGHNHSNLDILEQLEAFTS